MSGMRSHGDHDAMPYDGHNADLAHLCQICGEPMSECSAAKTGQGYWTCDVPGGCSDCRAIANEADDTEQFKTWNTEREG